jgi:hypothetical protein
MPNTSPDHIHVSTVYPILHVIIWPPFIRYDYENEIHRNPVCPDCIGKGGPD